MVGNILTGELPAVFRGFSTLSVDAKGRVAIPSRHRDRVLALSEGRLVLTLNPLDRCLWLYPLTEWELVEAKLQALSDFDRRSRRTKQMMRGYATDCEFDGQGRILLPQKLREFAGIDRNAVFLGQGNKFEIWAEAQWEAQREAWLRDLDEDDGQPSQTLGDLSL